LRSAIKRLEAFQSSVRRHLLNAPPALLYEGDFRLEGGRRAAREMLDAGERPTAVVVANDMMALGVMQECRARGLRIPQELSLIGFDDIAFAELTDPPLTTVCLPRRELGRRAVEALMLTIEGAERQGIELHVTTRLVVRASTAEASL
jgi:DNA-binding LacI/PurR family transcriptional regulator